MIIIFWKGWGLGILFIIGTVQLAACYYLYGTFELSTFEQGDPRLYWKMGAFSGAVATASGAFLNRWRIPKEESGFSKARHTILGIPVEYLTAFWTLASLSQWGSH